MRALRLGLVLLGAALLLGSLFLTWSHQFSPAFLIRWGSTDVLRGVPHDPTAWQVFSVADVLLALLVVLQVLAGLRGSRVGMVWAAAGVVVALAFALHALAVPPTNGATVFDSSTSAYTPNSPRAGLGETVAIVGLAVSLLGLSLAAPASSGHRRRTRT